MAVFLQPTLSLWAASPLKPCLRAWRSSRTCCFISWMIHSILKLINLLRFTSGKEDPNLGWILDHSSRTVFTNVITSLKSDLFPHIQIAFIAKCRFTLSSECMQYPPFLGGFQGSCRGQGRVVTTDPWTEMFRANYCSNKKWFIVEKLYSRSHTDQWIRNHFFHGGTGWGSYHRAVSKICPNLRDEWYILHW